jgi:hypothetical protein
MIIHFLTIDILLGVLGGGVFASSALGTPLPPTWWIVVPGATWCVYALDRILDARRAPGRYPTLRHAFHQRHEKMLIACIIVIAPTCGIIGLLTLPPTSLLVACVVLAFFLVHHAFQRVVPSSWVSAVKDVNVVIAYCISIWAIPLLEAREFNGAMIAAMIAHATMVLGTVVAESIPDTTIDTSLDQPNISIVLGAAGIRVILVVMFAILGAATWFLRDTALWPVTMLWAASVLVFTRFMGSTLPLPYRRMAIELTLALPLLVTGPALALR